MRHVNCWVPTEIGLGEGREPLPDSLPYLNSFATSIKGGSQRGLAEPLIASPFQKKKKDPLCQKSGLLPGKGQLGAGGPEIRVKVSDEEDAWYTLTVSWGSPKRDQMEFQSGTDKQGEKTEAAATGRKSIDTSSW